MRVEATHDWIAALAKGGLKNHTFVIKVDQREYGEWLLEARNGKYAHAFDHCVWMYGANNVSVQVKPK